MKEACVFFFCWRGIWESSEELSLILHCKNWKAPLKLQHFLFNHFFLSPLFSLVISWFNYQRLIWQASCVPLFPFSMALFCLSFLSKSFLSFECLKSWNGGVLSVQGSYCTWLVMWDGRANVSLEMWRKTECSETKIMPVSYVLKK